MIKVETTINPIITRGEGLDPSEMYSNLDSKSVQGEILAFQQWMIKNYPNYISNGDTVIASGVFDDGTKAAFKKYGIEYASGVKNGQEPTPQQKERAAKRGLFFDKVKGWYSKGQQLGLFEFAKTALGITPAPSETEVKGGAPNERKPTETKNDYTTLYIVIALAAIGTATYFIVKSAKNKK